MKKQLKIQDFYGTDYSEVHEAFSNALNLMDINSIYELLEPTQVNSLWVAGFCYWETKQYLVLV